MKVATETSECEKTFVKWHGFSWLCENGNYT